MSFFPLPFSKAAKIREGSKAAASRGGLVGLDVGSVGVDSSRARGVL